MKLLCACAFTGIFGLNAAFAQANEGIVVGMQVEPPHLDPTSAASGAIDQVLYANVFEGLTRFAQDGSVVPGLAETWTISASGTQYIFKLQEGVTFHDGTEMDAKDVKFSLDRARDETSQNANKDIFEGIEAVDVIGPSLVKVTLKEADGSFLFKMAWGDAVIVAPESIGEIKQKPVGTGAFKFSDWMQGEQILLERYSDYWGVPANLDQAVFKFVGDPFAAQTALMAQDVDVFPAYPEQNDLSPFEADQRFQVLVGSTEGETILSINNKAEPFDDIRVRRAVAHAIDRQALIDGAMAGLGIPIGSHFAPHHPAYVDLTGNSTYDPALAIQLLTEAGFEEGFSTTLKLPPPVYARQGGEIIADQLRAVGIEVEIIPLDWAEWLEEVFNGKVFDLTIVNHPEPFDIGIYARADYYFQYDGVAFRAVMAELNTESNPARRIEWLRAAQQLLSEDYVNAYLFQLATVTVADARLKGLWTNAPTQATDLTGVYWKE